MTGETYRSNTLDDITLVPEPFKNRLQDRHIIDFRSERRDCFEWLLALGKTPKKGEGYVHSTVESQSHWK